MSANGSPAPAALDLALDLVPVAQHLRRRSARLRRSPNTCGWRRISFAVSSSATSAERARAALLEQQREEDDLEEDVAELVAELRVVAALGGVGELVGLLDRVRDDRALVLLAVPGALPPQPAGDLVEALELRPASAAWRRRCRRAALCLPAARPGGRCRRARPRAGRRRRRRGARRPGRAAARAAAGGRRLIGPCGRPTAAGAPKTPLVPGAIGRVDGTGASQPWVSATSSVHGSGGGSAFEQRSIR